MALDIKGMHGCNADDVSVVLVGIAMVRLVEKRVRSEINGKRVKKEKKGLPKCPSSLV